MVDDDREAVAAEAWQPDAPAPGRQVQLAFTDGFADDPVIVRVDGTVAAEVAGLTTQPLLGLAGDQAIAVPEGSSQLEVELPGRGLMASATLDEGIAAVSVSVEGGALVIRPYAQELGFA